MPVANTFAEAGGRHHRMAIEPLEYARAERRYAAVQAEFPHDPVARHMLAHVAKMAREPVAGS